MKTPEEVAAEVVGHYEDRRHIKGRTLTRRVAEAIAAERQRADVLAEALRVADDMIANCAGVPNNPDSLPRMLQAHFRAALAAYDAEAK